MNEFNSMELKILNLIKLGKTRSDILAAKITTPANVQLNLSSIYSKTEDEVKYKTARNKFEELACYLRNNPDAFGPLPEVEEPKAEETEINDEIVKSIAESAVEHVVMNYKIPDIIQEVEKAVGRISTKLKAKLELLDEVCAEIVKELGDVR